MRIFLRVFFILLLLGGVAAGLAFWKLDRIVEGIANDWLSRRGGGVEVRAVDVSFAGVEIDLEAYREPGISVENAVLAVEWWTLFRKAKVGDISASADRVRIDLGRFAGEGEEVPADPKRAYMELAAALEAMLEPVRRAAKRIPAGRHVVAVERLELAQGDATEVFRVESRLESSGTEYLRERLKLTNDWLDAKLELVLLDGGARAGLDFGLVLKDGPDAIERLRAAGLGKLEAAGLDVYPYPLEASESLGSLAGYLRWHEAATVQVRGAILGNLGPADIYRGMSDATLGAVGAGLAVETGKAPGGFVTVPLERANLNGWPVGNGQFRLSLAGTRGIVSFKGDGVGEVELRTPDVFTWSEGNGRIDAELELSALNGALLSAIDPSRFIGWRADGSASAKLRADLADWEIADASGGGELKLKTFSTPEGIGAEDLKLVLNVSGWARRGPVGQMKLTAKRVDAAGVGLADLRAEVGAEPSGRLNLSGLHASVFGGEAGIEALTFDPARPSGGGDAFHLRMRSLNLEEVASAVPQFEGEIRGRVSGALRLRWEGGMALEGGELSLDSAQSGVEPRLSYSVEGLFTSGMAKDHPSYRQYRLAELALEDLSLSRLRVLFFPDDDLGRVIEVKLFGESEQAGIVVPIDFTLNVNADQTDRLLRLLKIIRDGNLEINF